MVIKINYTSSDIYVSTNVSPVYVVVNYSGVSGGGAVWGGITGTLSNQLDLQAALDAKFDDPTGTTAQYLRGDGSLATFPTIPGGTVTSVDMTVPTGLTVSGNPITSAGTLAVALASGYSIPTTTSQANWDAAYNDKINSAAVTGTSTKTLTLNQQDGGTVTASWSDIDTGLTSVGLTMPSAFAVANSPLTSNGTLAVTGAGTAAQYVRGDGALATFPSTASGGSSVNYYLNGSVNASVAGYKQLDNNAIIGAGTNFALTGNGLIAQFLTDVGNPNRVEIPGGAWNFEMFFQVSSSGGNQKFYVELLKYNGTTFTSIASSSAIPEEITGGTSIDLYLTSLAVPTTALLVTDRLAIRVYIVDNAGGRTVTLHTEDNTLCEIITTFAGGIAALNGLSANTQYLATGTSGTDFNISSLTDTHTFNLPTASATNRGALSTTDWSTFSGKVGGSGVIGQVAYWNGTSSQTGSSNLFWDNANARLGIGTSTPSSALDVLVAAGATWLRMSQNTSYYYSFVLDNGTGSLSLISTYPSVSTLGFNQSRAGNVQIGTTSDDGNKLLINGNTKVSGNLTLTGSIIFPAGNNVTAPSVMQWANAGGISGVKLLNLNTSTSVGFAYNGSTGTSYLFGRSGFDMLFGIGLDESNMTTSNATFYIAGTNKLIINKQTSINDASPSASAIFNISSTTQGFLAPRMTTTQRDAIATPATGLQIYNTTTNTNDVYNGTAWVAVGGATPAGSNTQIQYNNSGAFGASAGLVYNDSTGGMTLAKNQNADTFIIVKNETNNTAARAYINLITSVGTGSQATFGKNANSYSGYKILAGGDTFLFNSQSGDIAFLNDFSTGKMKWAMGGSSTAQMTLTAAGRLLLGTTTESTFLLDVNGTSRIRATGNGGNDGLVLISQNSTAFVNIGYNTIETNQSTFSIQRTSGALGIALRGTTSIIASTNDAFDGLIAFPNNSSQSLKIGYQGIQSTYQDIFLTKNTGEISVGINSTTTITSAVLHASSTTKGFLPPRMTTTEKNAIATPATGLQVYDTTLGSLNVYNGTSWVALGAGGGGSVDELQVALLSQVYG